VLLGNGNGLAANLSRPTDNLIRFPGRFWLAFFDVLRRLSEPLTDRGEGCPMFLAVAAALASAACFAAGSAVQHRVAGDSSGSDESGTAFFARLVRRPSWLLGLLLSAVAFSLHAFALSQGDLALVQPVIVSGVVFAVLFRAALEKKLPPRRVLVWLPLTWAGLALFLIVRPAESQGALQPVRAVWFVVIGVVVVVSARLLAERTSVDRRRGLLLGGGSGALFGLVAGLAKTVLGELGDGFSNIFVHWHLWALLGTGLWAVLLNQRAYQVSRLSVSAPILNILQVFTAVGFGIVVFGEEFGSSPGVLVGEVVGLLVVILGVYRLASRTAEPDETPAGESAEADRSTAA
jgi:drug/metabolite transporter (DMT)-like permease